MSDVLSEKEIEIYSQLTSSDFRLMADVVDSVGNINNTGIINMVLRLKLIPLGLMEFAPYNDPYNIYRLSSLGQKLKRFHERVEGVLGVD